LLKEKFNWFIEENIIVVIEIAGPIEHISELNTSGLL